MIWLLLAAVATVDVPPPPTSASAVAGQGVDPARLAAAKKLVALTKIDSTLESMFVQLSPSFARSVLGELLADAATRPVIDALVSKAPDNRERMIAILSQEFMRSVKSRFPGLLGQVARRYAEVFTADELNAINAFYSSGPGAKALTLLPQLQVTLSQDGRELGKAAGQEAGLRAFQRIEAEMVPSTERTTS